MPFSSGFYENRGGINAGAVYALQNDRPTKLRQIGRLVNSKAMGPFKERLDAAIVASTGEATVRTDVRVVAKADLLSNAQGGVRTIEQENVMDNATITAVENTELLQVAQYNPGHDLPVEDSSGNGGGGALTGRYVGA